MYTNTTTTSSRIAIIIVAAALLSGCVEGDGADQASSWMHDPMLAEALEERGLELSDALASSSVTMSLEEYEHLMADGLSIEDFAKHPPESQNIYNPWLQCYFGWHVIEMKGANTGNVYVLQRASLDWCYDGESRCYTDVFGSGVCSGALGFQSAGCATSFGGGGNIIPWINNTASYSASGGHSITIAQQASVQSTNRLVDAGTTIETRTLPEPVDASATILTFAR